MLLLAIGPTIPLCLPRYIDIDVIPMINATRPFPVIFAYCMYGINRNYYIVLLLLLLDVISCVYKMLMWCDFIQLSALSMFDSQHIKVRSFSNSEHHAVSNQELDSGKVLEQD